CDVRQFENGIKKSKIQIRWQLNWSFFVCFPYLAGPNNHSISAAQDNPHPPGHGGPISGKCDARASEMAPATQHSNPAGG
ncbi:MAG: hypothetical protein VYE16_03440, partial [Cyanobacteriota bacterium]|nr:hypothetical protein [Cyanobacteriota bacterium]